MNRSLEIESVVGKTVVGVEVSMDNQGNTLSMTIQFGDGSTLNVDCVDRYYEQLPLDIAIESHNPDQGPQDRL